jgi:hypothetical protein
VGHSRPSTANALPRSASSAQEKVACRARAVLDEADMDDDQSHTPEASGLDVVIRVPGVVIEDDLELFRVTDQVYDGL